MLSTFWGGGYAATSTPPVREAARVIATQIYHYSSDRDDLTKAVITFQTEAVRSGRAAGKL